MVMNAFDQLVKDLTLSDKDRIMYVNEAMEDVADALTKELFNDISDFKAFMLEQKQSFSYNDDLDRLEQIINREKYYIDGLCSDLISLGRGEMPHFYMSMLNLYSLGYGREANDELEDIDNNVYETVSELRYSRQKIHAASEIGKYIRLSTGVIGWASKIQGALMASISEDYKEPVFFNNIDLELEDVKTLFDTLKNYGDIGKDTLWDDFRYYFYQGIGILKPSYRLKWLGSTTDLAVIINVLTQGNPKWEITVGVFDGMSADSLANTLSRLQRNGTYGKKEYEIKMKYLADVI